MAGLVRDRDPATVRVVRHPLHPRLLLVVAAGGAVGAVARYALGEAFPGDASGFPWTTFGVNVVGSALLAALPALTVVRRSHYLPALLGTGVLGGFTTLSAYSDQARRLLAEGSTAVAAAYLVGTLAACLAVVALVDQLSGPEERAEFEQEEGDY